MERNSSGERVLTRQSIVESARRWLGTPYRHQASVRGVGCDCLGLVRGVWREVIGCEPEPLRPYAPDWAEATGKEMLADVASRYLAPIEISDFQRGDVLLFRWRERFVAKHAALVASPSTMIHAHDGAVVCEVALSPWWRRRIAFAFRFPGVC